MSIKGITDEEIDNLVADGLRLLKKGKYNSVSRYLFQRSLKLDGQLATITFVELQKIGALSNAEMNEHGVLISLVDHEKLKELTTN